jgi:hypothetical protein
MYLAKRSLLEWLIPFFAWVLATNALSQNDPAVARRPPSLFELLRARNTKAAPQRSDGGAKEEGTFEAHYEVVGRVFSKATRPANAMGVSDFGVCPVGTLRK